MIKPSYDLSTLKTNHGIILFVRDQILEPMNLRIRLYPSFVKQANKCETRDELIVLVHKITKKAANLARELAKETQKETQDIEVTCPHCEIITEMSSDATTLMCPKCLKDILNPNLTEKQIGVTKKVVSPKRLHEQEKTLVDSSPRERDISPDGTDGNLKGNTDLTKLGLSVWEQLHRYTPDVADPEKTSRLAYYSKYQDIIKEVIDRFQVITASDGVTKNHEAGLKPVSFKVLSRLLNDLYTDGFLELESIKCGSRNLAYVFSTPRCSKERFNRYTKRFRDSEQQKNGVTKKGTRQNMSHEQKVNTVLTHNEAVRKGTIELKEKEEKQFIEYSKNRREKQQGKDKDKETKLRYDPTQDEGFIKIVKEMKPSTLKHDLEYNPMFKKHYDILKKAGVV